MASRPNVLNLLLGRPLATSEERGESIGPVAGIPLAILAMFIPDISSADFAFGVPADCVIPGTSLPLMEESFCVLGGV